MCELAGMCAVSVADLLGEGMIVTLLHVDQALVAGVHHLGPVRRNG